jgi:GntR family transcriptional regulator
MTYDSGWREDAVPRFHRIELELRDKLSAEVFRETGFPTEDALCQLYGVSRMTVRHALAGLEADGLIERHRGKRTVIRRKPQRRLHRHPGRLILGIDRDLRMQGAEPRWKVLGVHECSASEEQARELSVDPGTQCIEIQRLGLVENEPVWYERHLMPLDVGRALRKRDIANGVLAYTIDSISGPITDVLLRVRGEDADTASAQLLDVQVGFHLLVCSYTLIGGSQRPLDALTMTYRSDRLEMNFAFKNQPEVETVLSAALRHTV